MRVEYDVVRLWEQDPEAVLASGLVGLMPLVPLMQGQDVEALLSASLEVVESRLESQQERNEVLAITGLLASLRDQRLVVEFFRRRSLMNLLQQTSLFQELTQDKQARQEGRLETMQANLLEVLSHRFASLPV